MRVRSEAADAAKVRILTIKKCATGDLFLHVARNLLKMHSRKPRGTTTRTTRTQNHPLFQRNVR